MRALVTGAAGFIGSHLAEALLEAGWPVRGVDCFTDAYDPAMKRSNLSSLGDEEAFELLDTDLRTGDVQQLLEGVEVVFHLAAVPGVRASWSSQFEDYVGNNILATHRLLEAVRHSDVSRFVYASSSSVYGNAIRYPCREDDVPHPHSPYGVTKLSAEQLCLAYAGNFGVPAVALRYFSVFGPRQRPDMGVHRIIEAGLGRGTFSVFGTGAQVRDLTYVGDVVRANLLAAEADVPAGTVANVAGGCEASVNDLIDLISEELGEPVPVRRTAEQPGDVYRTGGSSDLAKEVLGWTPEVGLEEGLREQIAWHRGRDV